MRDSFAIAGRASTSSIEPVSSKPPVNVTRRCAGGRTRLVRTRRRVSWTFEREIAVTHTLPRNFVALSRKANRPAAGPRLWSCVAILFSGANKRSLRPRDSPPGVFYRPDELSKHDHYFRYLSSGREHLSRNTDSGTNLTDTLSASVGPLASHSCACPALGSPSSGAGSLPASSEAGSVEHFRSRSVASNLGCRRSRGGGARWIPAASSKEPPARRGICCRSRGRRGDHAMRQSTKSAHCFGRAVSIRRFPNAATRCCRLRSGRRKWPLPIL